MTIAVYFYQDLEASHKATYRLTMLDAIVSSTDENVLVLTEGPVLAKWIQKHAAGLRQGVEVLDVYDEAFRIHPTNSVVEKYPEIDTHLWAPVFLHTSLLNKKYTYDRSIEALMSYFEKIVAIKQIRAAHMGDLHAFHSLGILLFDKVLEKKGILRVMPFLSPVQGRHVMFDNLCMEIPGLEDRYNALLKGGINSSDKEEVDRYLNRYRRFVSTEVRQMFASARNQKKKTAGFLKTRIRQAKLALTQGMDSNPPLKVPEVSQPYVLLLLSKGENWLTNYAMPAYADIHHLALTLWKALPSGWNLIVKDHPLLTREEQRAELARFSHKLPNFFYVVDQMETPELIAGAQAITFLGSRSGIDALMHFKHIIVFGHKPLYFSFKNAPVHRVTDFETLPDIYRQCAEAPPPPEPVYAYFKAVLELSENHFGEPDAHVIRMERNDEYFQRVGRCVVKTIKEKTPAAQYASR